MYNETLKEKDFIFLKNLAESRSGIELSLNKSDHLINHIIKRIQALNLAHLSDYCDFLRKNPDEIEKFINAITNLSTDFFREKHHFEYLSANFLPTFLKDNNKLRVLSAGCSTGEEPYSIAMTLCETIIHPGDYDIEIFAIDINTAALESVKRGIYTKIQINDLNNHKKWFHPYGDNNSELMIIDDRLKRLLNIKHINLLGIWDFNVSFDIIFCRNVTIYFHPKVCKEIFKRFDRSLKVGGLLILGHSENLIDEKQHYISLGKTIYKKVK